MTSRGPILVVGGAPIDSPSAYAPILSAAGTVIAVDGGIGLCLAHDRLPDVAVGDMDSVAPHDMNHVRAQGAKILELEPRKDISDLTAALSYCETHGLTDPIVTAVSGGRIDHQLAVFGTLAHVVSLRPTIMEPDLCVVFMSSDSRFHLMVEEPVGTTVSVIPLLGGASVSLTGMRYPLDHAEMSTLGDLGLSNVVEEASSAVIVHRGIIAVIVPGKTG